MSNNLPRLLAELSEIAPEICQSEKYGIGPVMYIIGEYQFWLSVGTLCAKYQNNSVAGLPAHDWLQGALMRVIKSKDWGYKIQSPANTELTFAKVYFLPDGIFSSDSDSVTEALLTALIQALKGE